MSESNRGFGTPRPDTNQPHQPERRSFIKGALALLFGGLAALGPAGAGFYFFCDPLRRKTQSGGAVRVTSLEALPADGLPRKFTVVANQEDAWNKFPHMPVGAVYLRRLGEQKVQALNVACPHAGCFVDFNPEGGAYLCPCHQSSFDLEGAVKDPRSPSPRRLDSLAVEIRNGSEIWVQFRNFVAGQKEQIPIA